MKSASLLALLGIFLPALSSAEQSSAVKDVQINLHAVEELAGPEAAAKVDAAIRSQSPELKTPNSADLSGATGATPTVGDGELLQILYARGNLVISPSAKETLDYWAETFLPQGQKVEIISYSGNPRPSWSTAQSPAEEDKVTTYSLHEAIRTAFKRAIVVRDILIKHGVAEDDITVRAIGPAGDQGPAERVDVIALK